MLVAGLVMAVFSAVKVKDGALLYLGVFGLYGLRLMILNAIFRATFEVPESVSAWCAAVISYTILVPGALFLRARQ
jgi:hypothetical protein